MLCELQTDSTNKTAMEDCFMRSYRVFASSGSQNISALNLLASRFLPYHYSLNGHVDNTKEIIESCPFESTDDLNLDLAKFYECAKDVLLRNCRDFFLDSKCDSLDERSYLCDKKPINCHHFPLELSEDLCCDSPKLFTEEDQNKCFEECQAKEYFKLLLQKCFYDCVMNGSTFIADDNIDFDVAKKILLDHTNSSEASEWEKPISTAVDKCSELWTGLSAKQTSEFHSQFLKKIFQRKTRRKHTHACKFYCTLTRASMNKWCCIAQLSRIVVNARS
jgi:hypothetical protein